jgi:pimeloyl-ACP methyl ester carboxylesterase
VHDFGSGPPLLLMHANVVNSWAWEPLTPFLLDAGYRVVAFDQRDCGESVTEAIDYSSRADVIAVLDALGIGQAALVGNSVGGQVAVDTAVEFPDRVVALVTIGADISGWFPEMPPAEQAIDDALVELEGSDDADAIAEADVRAWVDGPFQPPDRVPTEIRELVREMDRVNADPARVRGRPIRLDPPAAARLGDLPMPLLAIAGELDFRFAAATADHLAEHVPNARALHLAGVAHLIGLEAPDVLARHILAFLAPLPRWT